MKIEFEIDDDRARITLEYLAMKADVSPNAYACHIVNEALEDHIGAWNDKGEEEKLHTTSVALEDSIGKENVRAFEEKHGVQELDLEDIERILDKA